VFKRIYGCSFMEYARHYRIAKACELLASGDLPLKEIAERLAFPDLPTFSKLFRKIAGKSPGAFRKAERGERAADGRSE
jgi:AraC-like DNA-binding protein